MSDTMQSLPCPSQCGFDLATLPARHKVRPEDGAKVALSCPLCGSQLELRLDRLGVLVRGSGARTEFLRWKLGGAATTGAPATVSVGHFQLRFDQLGAIEPREVCYPRVPAFRGEGGETIVPTLPVRTAFFDCVDAAALERQRREGQRADVVNGEYHVKLPLHGLPEPVAIRLPLATWRSPEGTEERAFRDVSLRVWPNLPVAEWRHHLVGLAATGPGASALLPVSPGEPSGAASKEGSGATPRVRLAARSQAAKDWLRPVGGGAAASGIQRGGEAIAFATDERPAWVALEIVDGGGGSAREGSDAQAGGLFAVPAATAHAEGQVQVGLDFGTSNTCVALAGETVPDTADGPRLLPAVDEKKWNLYLVRGGPEAKLHAGPDLWPAPSGFGPKGDLFASELLFARSRIEQMRHVDTVGEWRLGVDFGLASAGAEPLYPEADYVLGDFKWRELLQTSAPTFAARLESLQAHYLAAVLMVAYARAATAFGHAPSSVQVSWSYPTAFHQADLETLQQAADTAQALLERATGVEWRLARGADESVAAAANAGDPGANLHVYLDMGGGSSEIAVKLERPSGKWETLYLTSVRYAGMSLLAAYEGEGKATSCLAAKVTMDVLRRRVREARHATEVLGSTALFNKVQEVVRQNRTAHFYGYLTEYVARVLAAGFFDQRFRVDDEAGRRAFPRRLKIALFFLGNGWRFNVIAPGDDYKKILANAIFQRLGELLTGEQSPHADKIRQAIGELELDMSAEELLGLPHEKAAIAMGLLKPEGKAQPGLERALAQRGIVGWTTSVGQRRVPWYAMYETGNPRPPSLEEAQSGAGAMKMKLSFGAAAPTAQAAAGGDSTVKADYYDKLAAGASLDWEDAPPRLPRALQPPFELDTNLNQTRGALKRQCLVTGRTDWFGKGAYEVMLEELFRKKLRTIGG